MLSASQARDFQLSQRLWFYKTIHKQYQYPSVVVTTLSDIFNKAPSARPGVQRTPELARILALPRRSLDLDKNTIDGAPIPDLTPLYIHTPGPCSNHPRCPVCVSGSAKLWPTQSAALIEAEKSWGLFGPMGVGSGKTLVTLLLPDVLQSKRSVLLVPASLRDQLLGRDLADYGRHFRLPPGLVVVAYSELSVVQGADALEKAKPDLVIADECHLLARFSSARTKRFARYFRANPSTRFCGVSGTVTRRSLRDFAHLVELALRAGSPVPVRWTDLQEWADAIDPIRDSIPVGALRVLTDTKHPEGSDDQRAAVRQGFRRRLVETPGVVATSESWEGASLVVAALRPEVPAKVQRTLDELRRTWQIEDEEIDDPMRLVAVARQIASGFYYRWCWPGGVRDEEWLKARAEWHRSVRQILRRSTAGLDSPLLVARAAARGDLDIQETAAWTSWKAVKDRYNPTPPVETVWIDKFVIEVAEDWDADLGAGIVWYNHDAVGEALADHFPVYGSGTDAGSADPSREPVIACSIRAQGIGKNLQRYSGNLVLEPPASGAAWEQLIGRTHRHGQRADAVWVNVLLHTPELETAMSSALSDARYVQETQGQRQKLLAARRIGWE